MAFSLKSVIWVIQRCLNINLEITSSNNGARATKMNVSFDTEAIKSANHKKPTQSHDLIDSPVSGNENLEVSGADIAETSASETQTPDLESGQVSVGEPSYDMNHVTSSSHETTEAVSLESEQASVDEQGYDTGDDYKLDET
jgi:hypothetical protein